MASEQNVDPFMGAESGKPQAVAESEHSANGFERQEEDAREADRDHRFVEAMRELVQNECLSVWNTRLVSVARIDEEHLRIYGTPCTKTKEK